MCRSGGLKVWCMALCLLVLQCARADTVTLVAEDDWWPYSAPRNGVATGFAVDVVAAAMEAAHMEVRFKLMPFSRCVHLMQIGQELGCFDMLKDETTTRDFLFPKEPLFEGVVAIYARTDFDGTATVASLENKRVGMTNGYTYGPAIENNPKIQRDVAQFDIANLRKLARGRIDFALLDTRVQAFLMQENWAELGGKIKQVGIALPAPLFTAFSRKHPDGQRVMEALDKGLHIIKSNGTYAKIEAKWDFKPKPRP